MSIIFGWLILMDLIPEVQLPSELIKGEGPQLQKAIEVALKELDQKPPVELRRPAYPVKVRH